MSEQSLPSTKLLAAVYLLEVAVLSGMFALAAATSPDFALGPIARVAVAGAIPLPCHSLLLAHFAWARRSHPKRPVEPVPALRPQPLPA